MRTFTTLIAIAAFALHVLLGCCWHHAHGVGDLAGHERKSHGARHVHLPTWLSPVHCCGHQHGSQQPEHEQKSSDEPTPHAPCHDPACVYLVCDQAAAPAASDVVLAQLAVDELRTAQDFATSAAYSADREKISPHVRRHLALSQFLN